MAARGTRIRDFKKESLSVCKGYYYLLKYGSWIVKKAVKLLSLNVFEN